MSVPTNRDSFKQWCLRRLGAPVIQINVSDDQVDDRVDEALNFWYTYHYEGTEKLYFKYQIQPADVANRYVTLPSNIINVTSIFPVGSSLSTNNLFNIRYQIALNDLYDLTATTMVPYYLAMQHIQFLELLLVGNQPIRFNRHNNILYLDMDWSIVGPGQYLVVECYGIIDPTTYSDVWNDWFLQRYTTALVKRQWGENLSKFKDMPLPGGMKFNGEKIYNDAVAEIDQLEQDMIDKYSAPCEMFIG